MPTRSEFEDAALAVLADRAHAPTTARTFAALYEFLAATNLRGTCHMASTVAFVLLREQDVNAVLCIGNVGDVSHSWIEIDAEVYDVAIACPEPPGTALAPVMASRHIYNGMPAVFVYGAGSRRGLDADASLVARMNLGEYMDRFPMHEQGLWGVAVEVGGAIGLATSVSALRERYANVRRVLREPTVASITPDDARRERNRRKRERQGRR